MKLLYIDPGTGSMLFSLVIGLVATASFALRALYLKLKFVYSGGGTKEMQDSGKSEGIVIFSDHKRYWNVFKPVCDELEKRGVDAVFYTASPDDPALSAGYAHIRTEYLGEGNRPYAKLNMLHADILLATTPGLDVYQWKRSKYVKYYVHLPHTVDDLASYRMFALDYYDAVLVSGQNQIDFIRNIESLRPAIRRKDLVTVGSTYLDAMAEKLRQSPRPQNERPVVLVAPSWGKSGILSRYGDELLSSLSSCGFHIIVRPHPQTVVSEQEILKTLTEKFSQLEWNYDNDNFDVLNKADIMITDFSGIIYDFALVFGKPVIYADTNFDTLPYDADWLSEPMWSLRVLPKIGVQLRQEDFPNLKDIISQAMNSHSLKDGLDSIRTECWEHQGKSAELVADWLINKQKTLS